MSETKRVPQTLSSSSAELLKLKRENQELRKRNKVLHIKAQGLQVLAGKVLQDSQESNARLKEEVEQLKYCLNQRRVDATEANLSDDDDDCKYGVAEQGCSCHSSLVKLSTGMQDHVDVTTTSGPQSLSPECNFPTLLPEESLSEDGKVTKERKSKDGKQARTLPNVAGQVNRQDKDGKLMKVRRRNDREQAKTLPNVAGQVNRQDKCTGEENIRKVSKTEWEPHASLPELQVKNARKKTELEYIGVISLPLQTKKQNNGCVSERTRSLKHFLADINNKMMQLNLAGEPSICQGEIVRPEEKLQKDLEAVRLENMRLKEELDRERKKGPSTVDVAVAQAPSGRRISGEYTCAAQKQQEQRQALGLTVRGLEACADGPDEHFNHLPAPPKEKVTPTSQQHKVKRHVRLSKKREEENQGLRDDLLREYEEKRTILQMELKHLSNELEGYELERQEIVIYRCEQLKQDLVTLSQDIERIHSQAQAQHQAQMSLSHQTSDSACACASQVPHQQRPRENGLRARADEPDEEFNHVPSPPKEKATRSSQRNNVKRKELSESSQLGRVATSSTPEVYIVGNTPDDFRTCSPQLYVSFHSVNSAVVYVQSSPALAEPETR